MKCFTKPNLKIYWLANDFLQKSPQLVHMVRKKFLRMSDGFANRLFCQSDISRVKLQSNWTVGERLLSSDSKTVWKSRLTLWISLLIFLNSCFGNSFISEKFALKEPLNDVMLHSGNSSECQMSLQTDDFVDRTFRGSNWSPTEQLVKGC